MFPSAEIIADFLFKFIHLKSATCLYNNYCPLALNLKLYVQWGTDSTNTIMQDVDYKKVPSSFFAVIKNKHALI